VAPKGGETMETIDKFLDFLKNGIGKPWNTNPVIG
jgi:hypothetical protein